MVKIRLRKTGCNRVATFRVVACDSRSPRDGKLTSEKCGLNLERIAYWTSQGAQLSETVASLVKQARKAAAAAQA